LHAWRRKPFSPHDLEFLSLIGNQVAIAVENALAYREIAELKDQFVAGKIVPGRRDSQRG